MTRTKISVASALIAHILAWAATLILIFLPAYSGGETLVEVNGVYAALLLVIPIALTAIALIATLPNAVRPCLMLTLRWASSVLLILFCVAGMLSIGVFYLPAALVLLIAVVFRGSGK